MVEPHPLVYSIDYRTVMQLLSFAAATFISLWSCTGSLRDTQFGLKVLARSTECFYEETSRADTRMDVFVRVLRGGKLDIGLSIYDPEKDEKILSALVERDSKPVTLNLSASRHVADYKICLDNSFSLVAKKLVQLIILVHEDSDYYEGNSTYEVVDSDLLPEHNIQSNVSQELTSVQHRLTQVAWQLLNVTHIQNYLRGLEARHRLQVESNNRRVVMWSILEVVVIVFASLVQVIVTQSILKTHREHRT